MLSHLGRFASRHRILILGTYRPGEVGPGHPLAQVLDGLGEARPEREVVLGGLEPRAVGRLLPWLERSPAWSVNFPFTACHAAETLWSWSAPTTPRRSSRLCGRK